MSDPLTVSPDEAARLLSLHKRTIYRLVAERKLVARKAGARTLIEYAGLKAYLLTLPELSGAPMPNSATRRRPALCQ